MFANFFAAPITTDVDISYGDCKILALYNSFSCSAEQEYYNIPEIYTSSGLSATGNYGKTGNYA